MDVEKNKAFTLIEMAVVIAVLSILSTLWGPNLLRLVRRGNSVSAGQAMRQIRNECESDYVFGSPGTFTPRRIPQYSLTGNCDSASAIPKDEKNNPTYSYTSATGLITCSYKNAESTSFPSCKKLALGRNDASSNDLAALSSSVIGAQTIDEDHNEGNSADLPSFYFLNDGMGMVSEGAARCGYFKHSIATEWQPLSRRRPVQLWTSPERQSTSNHG
ncbi:type II secretion system protein [Prochlorococcus marinus]|uniref:Type II secretory pathway, pseudopilin PulG n=1 Tax=Prochlorococcus marinus (strain MIT 9211) TaxID=93059 RepID=A9BC78_PROM4|nr:type II secretion system protein [Prochlorococcus marinus]ABX09440.1 Type II secretory pathway, pseudopilin PulG [Prochlorococcus marinus str. MIT 9211]